MAPVAYFGGLEQTLPFFVGKKGVCPALAHLVGDESGLPGDCQRKFHKKERLTTSVFGPSWMQSVNHPACSGI